VQLLFSLTIFLLSSCQNSGERPAEFSSYYLEKEEEFLIHSLASVELLDYYPEDGLYLGYTITPDGNEITLVNEEGEIVLSKNMQGEGPKQYPSNLSCLAFSETGEIWAMTSVQVLRYDQNLKLLEKFAYRSKFTINLYSILKRFPYFRKDTNSREIIFPVVPSGVGRYDPGNYKKATLLEIYDRSQNFSKEIAPVSRRRVTEEFYGITGGSYAPVYALDAKNAILYLTSTFDSEISVYDLNVDSSPGSMDIYYEDPHAVEPPKPIGSHTLSSSANNWLICPMNKAMYMLDNGMFALEYLAETLINPNPRTGLLVEFHPDNFKNRLILFDQNRQLSGDISIPERGIVMTSLPGNRLLVKAVNTEKEEDFTRYVIYKVVEE